MFFLGGPRPEIVNVIGTYANLNDAFGRLAKTSLLLLECLKPRTLVPELRKWLQNEATSLCPTNWIRVPTLIVFCFLMKSRYPN